MSISVEQPLPGGWISEKLSSLISPRGEKVSPRDFPDLVFLGMDHIEAQTCRIIGSVPASEMKSNAARFFKGDVLYGRLRPYLNKVTLPSFDGLASAEFIVFPDNAVLRSSFLKYRLSARDFVNFASHLNEGDRPRVNFQQIGQFKLLVPPSAEQERIVEKVEELFSEIEQGIYSLKTAREQLNVYRQAVLKQAFEGKLTAKWREENADKLESADEISEHIKQEREAQYKERLADWEQAVQLWKSNGSMGRKPTRLKQKPFAELSSEELGVLPKLPKGHLYTYLSNIGDLGRGKSKHRPRNDPKLFGGQYPFLQTAEVKAADRIIREYNQTYNDVGLDQSFLWPKGTLCITIAANIAETAFLGFDACFPDSVVGFTASPNLVLPEYVELFIKAIRVRIEEYAPATAQKNINLTTLENLVIPICSLGEQTALVDYVERVLSNITENEKEIERALRQSELLRQSILKKAFSGELVPQDPNDEPASVLLERMRAQKEAARSATKLKGRN